MSEEKNYGFNIPWNDTTKWTKGFWYPLPTGFYDHDDETIVDGWDIFKSDDSPEMEWDDSAIDPIGIADLTFSQALLICEKVNGEKLIEREDEEDC